MFRASSYKTLKLRVKADIETAPDTVADDFIIPTNGPIKGATAAPAVHSQCCSFIGYGQICNDFPLYGTSLLYAL